MISLTKTINALGNNIDDRLTKRFDAMLKKSPILAMFAQHLHVIGERFSVHAVAINQDKIHISDLQKQVDLLRETMSLMVQAKTERFRESLNSDDFQDDLPN